MRPTHWLKNGVVFAALIFAGEASHPTKDYISLLAFLVFCLAASGVYIFNDIIDRDKDKLHPIKKNRPIASGAVALGTASVVMVILMAAGLFLASLINRNFLYITVLYIVFNLLYSLKLKDIVIIDVMSIAFSFVLRAYAGALAINVPTSKWLVINTILLSLFLSFGKRRHELLTLEQDANAHRKILEKYSPYLLDQMIAVVTPAVVVMYMLYSFSSEVSQKLGTENLFLTIPFVIYGIFRYLYLIHKEEKGGSPTKILITDIPIFVTVLLWILTVIIILYLL